MNDITITYKVGDDHGFVKANTAHGQQWLWKHKIEGVRFNNSTMASAKHLLALIGKMENLTVTWKKN